jgi:leader peptidase (prepilin peptidase)/N-methyltransferase
VDLAIPILVFGTVSALLIGAAVGSFLNVCIWRLATDRSVVWPGSHCPACLSPIRWYDNIPVIAGLWLGWKCRDCRRPVSPAYALGELCVGVLFAATWLAYWTTPVRAGLHGWGPWTSDVFAPGNQVVAAHLVLVGFLWTASLIDIRYKIIPAAVTDWGIGVGLAASLAVPALHLHGADGRPGTELTALVGWASAAGWIATYAIGRTGLWERLSPFRETGDPPVRQPIDVEAAEFAAEPDMTDEEEARYQAAVRGQAALEFAMFLPVLLAAAAPVVFGFDPGPLPDGLRSVGAGLAGVTAGAGVVWLIRIFASFLLAKEAMGLGDVYLMAMVGAFLGWQHAVIAFFLAPFPGLAFVVLLRIPALSALLPQALANRQIPFGPSLALASYAVMLAYRPIAAYFSMAEAPPLS